MIKISNYCLVTKAHRDNKGEFVRLEAEIIRHGDKATIGEPDDVLKYETLGGGWALHVVTCFPNSERTKAIKAFAAANGIDELPKY